MTRFRLSSVHRKHLPDLVAGMSVLALLGALIAWHVAIAMGANGSTAGRFDWNASAVLLVGAILAMAVFNMAFFRHLSRAYADPRKAQRRRRDTAG